MIGLAGASEWQTERRGAPRLKRVLPATWKMLDRPALFGFARKPRRANLVSLSQTGAAVLAPRPRTPKRGIRVELTFGDLDAVAVVRRFRPGRRSDVMFFAVEFVSVAGDLARYIADLEPPHNSLTSLQSASHPELRYSLPTHRSLSSVPSPNRRSGT